MKVHPAQEALMQHITSTHVPRSVVITGSVTETNVFVAVDGEVSIVRLNYALKTAPSTWDKGCVTWLVFLGKN